MPFFQPEPRRRPYPPRYRQNFGPPYRARQMQPYISPNQPTQGRLPDHVNTIMGHVGIITNGVNMLRQMGSLLSLFR
ncbi:hypothetical protein MHB44_09530 [Lysinibacillus sp. FSL H8-0500]|uniref:hypothetical protein n=1 Tax=Lysinibacillus sp. FSL H8-0500 TaxID=2921393 RepID=UPI0031014168